MFDISICDVPPHNAAAPNAFEIEALAAAMSSLSDSEIEGLEDDLNFFAFTGITSPRIESVLAKAGMNPVAKVANSNSEHPIARAS